MKNYGLIGYPLGHSFSKKYFEEKFAAENITDAAFELYPIQKVESINEIISANKNLQGLAVTIPYKETVMPLLTHISEEAKIIGAVNCIKIKNGETTGYNTDVIGFQQSLQPILQAHHTHALVLGTGGASKAVQYVLHKLKINFTVVSRTKNVIKNIICYEEITKELLQKNKLIINCTPLGMSPIENQCPEINYRNLTTTHLLFDLIYKPSTTLFLHNGLNHGCQIKNGLEMLALQAEENWKIWSE